MVCINYALGLYERAARDLGLRVCRRSLCRLAHPVLRTPLNPLLLRASLLARSGRSGRSVLRTRAVACCGVLWRAAACLCGRVLRTHAVACCGMRVLRTRAVVCGLRGVRAQAQAWCACAGV